MVDSRERTGREGVTVAKDAVELGVGVLLLGGCLRTAAVMSA